MIATRPMAAPIESVREFAFDGEDFRNIAAMLYSDSGIFLTEQKASLVYGRLVKRLRSLGLESFRDYCRLVAGREGIDERQQMLSALTTNVTAFFRERHHFDHLGAVELPTLVRRARAGGRVRIWSAGCSKGHEPYSIALTVLGLMPDAAEHDIRILATDIDPLVLETGRAGVYGEDELAEVPRGATSKHFHATGQGTAVAGDALKKLISFRELNLMTAWPMKGSFDVVFCRNVTIYFDAATQARIWGRFAGVLAPSALLCIGHSERLSGDAARRFESVGTTMYRHDGGGK